MEKPGHVAICSRIATPGKEKQLLTPDVHMQLQTFFPLPLELPVVQVQP